MNITERSVQEIGKSLLITLPKDWTKALKVKKGAKLKLLVSERGVLSIVPELVQSPEMKEITIPYDEHFNRRFFKEYFEGYERIVVLFAAIKDRAPLYSFFKRFMNIQIIEENERRMVVKCFRIEELSMEECLHRMHYLSLSMLERNADQTRMKEARDTMTRFYYMLVMQVRRFLSEGKFTDTNQIPLIKAMDIRMVAEKIQRIAEAAETLQDGVPDDVAQYYRHSFSCFVNNDFAKALPLWSQGNAIQRKLDRRAQEFLRSKNVTGYAAIGDLQHITRYAKEISMLVR